MSISSEILRIRSLRNRLRTKLIALGLMLPIDDQGGGGDTRSGKNDLEDCVTAVEGISGTKSITNTSKTDVASYQYAQVSDSNLRSRNIVSGVTILGVEGSYTGSPQQVNLTTGTFSYGGAETPPSTVTPPQGYDGFSQFNIQLTNSNPTLIPSNIRNGVVIMGVTGNFGAPSTDNFYQYYEGTVSVSNSNTITFYLPNGFELTNITKIRALFLFCHVSSIVEKTVLVAYIGNSWSGEYIFMRFLTNTFTYGSGGYGEWDCLSYNQNDKGLSITTPVPTIKFNGTYHIVLGYEQ